MINILLQGNDLVTYGDLVEQVCNSLFAVCLHEYTYTSINKNSVAVKNCEANQIGPIDYSICIYM